MSFTLDETSYLMCTYQRDERSSSCNGTEFFVSRKTKGELYLVCNRCKNTWIKVTGAKNLKDVNFNGTLMQNGDELKI